jgi:ABC-type Fe3+/spermidine/putrescine transport system ATPase subunit
MRHSDGNSFRPSASNASATGETSDSDAERSGLAVEGVSHRFGSAPVLRDVSVHIRPGAFFTILGASGSGKTTLLRIIGGLIEPEQGRIRIDGRDVTLLPPERRDIGFVFQNYALFPHLTVAQNTAFALRMRGTDAAQTRRRVAECLALTGLGGLGDRYPAQLSGGQQQRVALARAIVFRPRLLLLDEPLGALDRQLRQQLAIELRTLQRQSGITMIYVTHDQEEAFTLSTEVAIMQSGSIVQIAPPQEMYRHPANLFAALFVGELNLVAGTILSREGAGVRVATAICDRASQAPAADAIPDGARVWLGIRPEHIDVQSSRDEAGPGLAVRVRVRTVIFGGSWHRIDLLHEPTGIVLRAEGRGEPRAIGEAQEVWACCDPSNILLFPNNEG